MKDIDFLPQSFHDQQARRQSGVWVLGVAVVLGSAVALASLSQFAETRRLRQLADQVQPEYAAAQAQTLQLATVQSTLRDARTEALLYAVVDAPWPRSQVLATITGAVTQEMRLDEFLLEPAVVPRSIEATALSDVASDANEKKERLPAETDLLALRSELAAGAAVCSLAGQTENVAALEAYLRQVEETPTVARVEMTSLENAPQDPNGKRLRFTAKVTLRAPLDAPPTAPAETTDMKVAER